MPTASTIPTSRPASLSTVLAVIGLLVSVGTALSGCFYVDAAAGQLALINRQEPLADAVASEPDPERRWMLAEVPRIKRFAREVMQLRPRGSYRGYVETEAEGLTYVLSGAERASFTAYTWWFPIAGDVPYKSHFTRAAAEAEAARLRARGYDIWISPSRAYSTLGILRDPVISTMMRDGPIAFVEVLLHELTHARLYVAGHTDFNEQLASFVAQKGIERYFAARRFAGTGALARVAARKARREQVEAAIFDAIDRLEALYARGLPEPQVLQRRQPIFDRLRARLRSLLPDADPARLQMNNAALMQYRRYGRNAPYLEAMWRQSGGGFRRFWELVEAYADQLD